MGTCNWKTQKDACDICGRVVLKRHIPRHKITHFPQLLLPCPKRGCAAKFTQKCNLQTHIRRHNSEAFPCDGCDYKTPDQANLLRHRVRWHGVQPPRGGKTYDRIIALRENNTSGTGRPWKYTLEKLASRKFTSTVSDSGASSATHTSTEKTHCTEDKDGSCSADHLMVINEDHAIVIEKNHATAIKEKHATTIEEDRITALNADHSTVIEENHPPIAKGQPTLSDEYKHEKRWAWFVNPSLAPFNNPVTSQYLQLRGIRNWGLDSSPKSHAYSASPKVLDGYSTPNRSSSPATSTTFTSMDEDDFFSDEEVRSRGEDGDYHWNRLTQQMSTMSLREHYSVTEYSSQGK